MKFRGKILAVKDNLAKIELNIDNMKPGQEISGTIGKRRSVSQNALYWSYLTHLIENCRLKDQGFFCPEALHESLKAYFLSEKELVDGKFKVLFTGSTTDLTKLEMVEYLQKVDDFVTEFFHVNTHKFWEEYSTTYGNY